MPTVLRVGPYRFFFYSGDGHEPPHIHVERDELLAKFWLRPVALANAGGLKRTEVRKVELIVVKHKAVLLESWNEYFGS